MASKRRRQKFSSAPLTLNGTTWTPPFPLEQGVSPRTFKCPLPQSDSEFAILSEIVWGRPLTLKRLHIWNDNNWGQFEIAEKYESFALCGQRASYDVIDWFRRTICGPMHCSASLTYTDFKRYGHRHWARLVRWSESRSRNDSRTVRPAFVRLARRFGVGENIVGRVDRRSGDVLTNGRADAALAASMQGR